MKKVNKNIFLFVDRVARVLVNGNRTIETVPKRSQPKTTHLKELTWYIILVHVQHLLDVYTTTK